MIFLVEYDRNSGALVQLLKFSNDKRDDAARARLNLELLQMKSDLAHEIVILEAASEEHLRRTHRRYFEPIRTLADPDAAIFEPKAVWSTSE